MKNINTNNSIKYDLNFKANDGAQTQPPRYAPLPRIYNLSDNSDKKTFKDKTRNFEFLHGFAENPLLMGGTVVGTLYGIDRFGKAFQGDYDKSIVGRAAKFGDKIGQSRFAQSQAVQKTLKALGNGASNFKKLIRKNDAIRAIFDTPGMPEWDSAKGELVSREKRLLEPFERITGFLELGTKPHSDSWVDILTGKDCIGLDKEEAKYIKNLYKEDIYKLSPEMQVEANNRILLRRLKMSEDKIEQIVKGENASEAVKNELRKAIGLTAEEIDSIKYASDDKLKELTDKLMKNLGELQKDGKKIRIGAGHYTPLNHVQPLERTIDMSTVYNNFHALTEPKTGMGKFMAKATQTLHKGCTWGCGKFCGLIFIAPAMYMVLSNTIKADKKEKVGTFTNKFIDSIGWVITFPIAAKLLHMLGGMQFAGATKAEVAKYREELAKLELKNKMGGFATKADYKAEAKKVLDIINKAEGTKNQSLFTKICKKMGSFLEIGNENPKGWLDPKASKLKNWFHRSGNFFKNFVGVPLRILLFFLAIQPLLDSTISKVNSKIFGKAYDDEKVEEHKENLKNQEKFSKQDLRQKLIKTYNDKLNGVDPKAQEQALKDEYFNKNIAAIEAEMKKENDVQNHGGENNISNENQKVPLKGYEQAAINPVDNTNNYELPQAVTETKDVPPPNVQQVNQSQNVSSESQVLPMQENQPTLAEQSADLMMAQPEATAKQFSQMIKEENNQNKGFITQQNANVNNAENQQSVTPYLATATTSQPTKEISQSTKEIKKEKLDDYTYIPSQDLKDSVKNQYAEKPRDYDYIPSQECNIKQLEKNKEKRYIPSQKNVVKNSYPDIDLSDVFARADKAEKNALNILAGKFPN